MGRTAVLKVANPDCPVGGGDGYCGSGGGHQFAGPAGNARRRASVEGVKVTASERRSYARKTIGRADFSKHGGGRIFLPADTPVCLPRKGPRPSAAVCAGKRYRPERTCLEALDGPAYCRDRGPGHFATVQARFRCIAHGKLDACPDVARIHFRIGFEHGNTPAVFGVEDGPVECRRTAVTDYPGVHDQTGVPAPHARRDRALQEWRNDEVRRENLNGVLGNGIVDIEFDADLVTVLTEFDEQTLCQAVERVCEEEDTHAQQILGSCSDDIQSSIRLPPKPVCICTNP